MKLNGPVSMYSKLKRLGLPMPEGLIEEYRKYHRDKKRALRAKVRSVIPWSWRT